MSHLPLEAYRSIGVFVDGETHQVYTIDKKSYLLATTGRSYKVYSLPDLKIRLLSPSFPDRVTHVAAVNQFTFLVCERRLYKFQFSHCLQTLELSEDVTCFTAIGRLLFVGFDNATLKVWDSTALDLVGDLTLAVTPRFIHHPLNYLNKVLVSDGASLLLYNVKNGRLLFNFLDEKSINLLFLKNKLTCIVNSPAPDVVALGFANGVICALNLKTATVLFQFDQGSPVTALAFTLDTSAPPRLVSGSPKGDLLVWNLNTRTVESKLAGAFKGGVSGLLLGSFNGADYLTCLSSESNAIKQFTFDEESASKLQLLRKRQGVSAPLRKIRFYTPRFILGVSSDVVCDIVRFSLFNDSASQKLSCKIRRENTSIQSEIQRNTDDLVDFSFTDPNGNIERANNLFTFHRHAVHPLFWDLEAGRLNNVFLELRNDFKFHTSKKYKEQSVKFRQISAIQASACGTYLFVGFDNGVILKLSTQSGKLVTDFEESHPEREGHRIEFLFTDRAAHSVIAVTKCRWFKLDFYKGTVLGSVAVSGSGVSQAYFDRKADLLVLSESDGVLHVYSAVNCTRTRTFLGLKERKAQVVDLAFASGDRKVILATDKSTLVIYDYFLNAILSEIRTETPIVSLDFSEEQGLLAVVYQDSRDICLWNVQNLHLRLPAPLTLPFVSPIKTMPANPREFLDAADHKNDKISGDLTKNQAQDVQKELVDSLRALVDASLPANSGIEFSRVPITQWKPLVNYQLMEKRTELDPSKFEEQEELPFFLKFGESILDKIGQQTNGSLEEAPKPVASKQLKKLEENELMESAGDPLSKLLSRVDLKEKAGKRHSEKLFGEVLDQLRGYSAGEIDYFLKKATMFDAENAVKFLAFSEWAFQRPTDYDFLIVVFRYFVSVS